MLQFSHWMKINIHLKCEYNILLKQLSSNGATITFKFIDKSMYSNLEVLNSLAQ